MKPKVTVAICVRNGEATIKEAMKSIIDQDFSHKNVEVIFVDDGSKDSTLSIIENYTRKMDMIVRVFHHEWKGLGYSRNLVVEMAIGKYIVWVDSDMILPPDHIRKQVEFMEKNPRVAIAKARYKILADENLFGFLENVGYIAIDFRHGGKVTSRALGTGGSIYRVVAIREIGGFDPNITGVGEDMDVEFRTSKAGWQLYLGTPAFFFERRRKSWISIWREFFWHGYGGYQILKKNKEIFAIYKMIPIAGLVAGIWYSTLAYRLIRRKIVFLLPFQYTFKRVAWCFGFIKGQIGEFINRFKQGTPNSIL